MRRLFILSALFSVLLALSQPLFACAMDMDPHDCCPAGLHDSGDDGVAACPDVHPCVTPSDAPAAVIQAQRDPQPLPTGAAPCTEPLPRPTASPRAPPIGPDPGAWPARHAAFAAATAALTYRNTARLRL